MSTDKGSFSSKSLESNNNQARLRLVVSNEFSDGYKSGRKRWRDMPVSPSIASTRSAGTRPKAIHPETVPCDLSPKRRANALCPPAASQASSNASLHMLSINAQSDNSVNANSGNRDRDNRRMAKQPTLKPSAFWLRLQEALAGTAWEPVNSNHVAKRLQMSQGSVHRWYLGTGLPELSTALQLAKEGGVCVDWLLNKVKPKYPISKDPTLKELLEICEELKEDGRKSVLRMAEGELARQQSREITETNSAKQRA